MSEHGILKIGSDFILTFLSYSEILNMLWLSLTLREKKKHFGISLLGIDCNSDHPS